MKTTILLGLLLTLTVSCKHHSNPVTTEENFHTQEANRLVAEARNLWLPPLDSTFFFNDSEHISINDKEIWAKLDSALAIDPTNYNPQNEMFRLLGTKRSFSQNETFFFSHPYPALFRLISHF